MRIDGERRADRRRHRQRGEHAPALRGNVIAAATEPAPRHPQVRAAGAALPVLRPGAVGRVERGARPTPGVGAQARRRRRRPIRPSQRRRRSPRRRRPSAPRSAPKGKRGNVGRLVVHRAEGDARAPRSRSASEITIGRADDVHDRRSPTTRSCRSCTPACSVDGVGRWSRTSARPTARYLNGKRLTAPRAHRQGRPRADRQHRVRGRVVSDHVAFTDQPAVRWGAATDAGLVRTGNEDAFVAEPMVFGVADGMGGHQAGEVASEIAAAHHPRPARHRRAATSTWWSPPWSRPTRRSSRPPTPTPTSRAWARR